MLSEFLIKLDWFGTLFPRIPVPIEKKLQEKFQELKRKDLPVEVPVVTLSLEEKDEWKQSVKRNEDSCKSGKFVQFRSSRFL